MVLFSLFLPAARGSTCCRDPELRINLGAFLRFLDFQPYITRLTQFFSNYCSSEKKEIILSLLKLIEDKHLQPKCKDNIICQSGCNSDYLFNAR